METGRTEQSSQASDHLMMQINIDNIMQVYKLFDSQASRLYDESRKADLLRDIKPCAKDPVSEAARLSFQDKINVILDAHEAHMRELSFIRDNLRKTAVAYGLIEDENADSMAPPPPTHPAPVTDR